MKKKPAKKKSAATDKPLPAHLRIPPVPPDHPIYQTGYVVGGRYPALKKQPTEREELDRIASELAIKHNADPADEEIKREAVYQHIADRLRREQLSQTGLGAQLSQTIEDVLAEVGDESTRQVLEKFQSNLAGTKPLTTSQLAKPENPANRWRVKRKVRQQRAAK